MLQLLFISIAFFLTGCGEQDRSYFEDLNTIKRNFLDSIMKVEPEEENFQMHYSLKTVFHSKDIISLFGEISVYDHLPHGWNRYEGRTFCKIDGKFKEIRLEDLFSTSTQKEFLRQYCENELKKNTHSYFAGEKPLRSSLELNDIQHFVLDDKNVIIFFQNYVAGGLYDGPLYIKTPYEVLHNRWNNSNPIALHLPCITSSKSGGGQGRF